MRLSGKYFQQRHDIAPLSVIAHELRSLLCSRLCIGVTVALLVAFALLTPGQYLFHLEFPARLATNVLATLVFCVATYFFLPRALHWGLRWNMPWLWIELIFYIPVSLIVAAGLVGFLHPTPSLYWLLIYFLLIMLNVFLAVTLTMLIFKEALLSKFSTKPAYFPLWVPSAPKDCGLCSMLPQDKHGDIHTIVAENQNILVTTDKGETRLRLSLTEAESLLPADTGLRVHRSHWIAQDRIQGFYYDNGNPRLVDKAGNQIPVSRAKVPDVKGIIDGPEPTPPPE